MLIGLKTLVQKLGRFFGLSNGKNVPTMGDLIQEMEQLLDHSESQPVQFQESTNFQYDLAALAEGAHILSNQEQTLFNNRFIVKTLAIQYRLEAINGGKDPVSVQPAKVNLLKALVRDWKASQELITVKSLTEDELYQLQAASQYPEFVEILIKDESVRGNFFLWIVRDGNEAKVFIEYPHLCEKIVAANLSARIGRINRSDLKIQKIAGHENGVFEKIVTLPFEGVEHSILNGDHEILFQGNYRLTVSEIFEVFSNKNLRVGDLEYLALGVTNWNCHKWAFWNADKCDYQTVDLSHRQWWKQLPIFEVITKNEAEKRYNKVIDGTSWCVAASATRGSATLDFENTHALLEIAIPFADGRYAVYDFGKFATQYPATFFEGVSIFCHNLQATVSYPDENVFYSHRQQMYHAFVVDENKGLALMNLLKKDMFKGRENNFVYQIESDNCAKWVQEHIEAIVGCENVPDMFRMHLLDTEPLGPVSMIFAWIKNLPQCMQTRVMTFCHLFLGATKKTWILENGKHVCKSLTRHEFWKTGEVFLPAFLHKKLESDAFSQLKALVEEIVATVYAWVKAVVGRIFMNILQHARNGVLHTQTLQASKLFRSTTIARCLHLVNFSLRSRM
jgi:hypothetical protein